MSEMISYKCPNTLELVIFDSAKNYCPHCNCEHLYPNAISRKKDNKWHKIKGMWIDETRFEKLRKGSSFYV